jgi:DNA mismatch endonuclease (patch repair protein)
MGYRYRLYRANLPGKPDLVFASRRAVIFVHGCFWHRHPGCRYACLPKTQTAYWQEKFAKNVERDERNIQKLTDAGWSVLVVWQCELKNLETLAWKIHDFLEGHQTRQSA